MALRYILLVAPDPLERQALAADILRRTGLEVMVATGPFIVLTSEARDALAMADGGAVIGPLFQRHGPPRAMTGLDAKTVEEVRNSGGAHLVRHYWGGYVAAIATPQGARILRPPMGALPCYHVQRGTMLAFASDADILWGAGLLDPHIDWAGLARHLYLGDLPTSDTAMDGLSELLPGTALSIRGGQCHLEAVWSPWDHVAADPGIESCVRAEQLGRIVHNCLAAWASTSSNILLSVSGGLDSSIVAASLAASRKPLTCLTLATDDPSGDERHYARLLCDHLRAPLTERGYALADVDLDRAVAGHLPRPCGRIHELAFRRAVQSIASDGGLDGYFTGNGGDNVFYNTASARPIADRFLAEGLGLGVIRTIRDICAITGCSAGQAVREAARLMARRRRAYPWRADTLFLHPDLIRAEAERAIGHPWLVAPPGALPGKSGHIAMLLRMQHHLDGYDRGLAFSLINPLVSQPIVEAALGIPSWQMVEGGANRAIARAAFKARLPQDIIARRSKAGPDSFIVQLLECRLPDIRARLLEGQLAARGLLDRDALDAVMRPGDRRNPRDYMRVMALLDTEAWISRWQDVANQCSLLSVQKTADAVVP